MSSELSVVSTDAIHGFTQPSISSTRVIHRATVSIPIACALNASVPTKVTSPSTVGCLEPDREVLQVRVRRA